MVQYVLLILQMELTKQVCVYIVNLWHTIPFRYFHIHLDFFGIEYLNELYSS